MILSLRHTYDYWQVQTGNRHCGESSCSFGRRGFNHSGGGPIARALVCSRLFSFHRRGLSHGGGGTIGKGISLFSPLIFGRRGLSDCGGGPIGKGIFRESPLFLWSA